MPAHIKACGSSPAGLFFGCRISLSDNGFTLPGWHRKLKFSTGNCNGVPMSARQLLCCIVVLWSASLSGCASDPAPDPASEQETDLTTVATGSGVVQERERQRQQMCDDIAQQLRAVGTYQPDGLFPFPEYRNRERDPTSPNAEIYELKDMQRRYRCGR